MAIDYARLMAWPFGAIERRYEAKDTILYALGIGLGADPIDHDQLRFVYEDRLRALPSMATVLANPGLWIHDPATGIDWPRALHGEQGLVLHAPLPPAGTITSRNVIEEIVDKGAGKGALIYSRRDLRDQATGALLATLTSTTFLRGDGGFGGPAGRARPLTPMPERAPDLAVQLKSLPQAALIYRLSGDVNPLHVDPKVAASAGYPRPILHGLCTYGIACHALLRALCGYDPARLRRFDLRFTAPVFPGETLKTEIWREGEGRLRFRGRVTERNVVVLDHGLAEMAPG